MLDSSPQPGETPANSAALDWSPKPFRLAWLDGMRGDRWAVKALRLRDASGTWRTLRPRDVGRPGSAADLLRSGVELTDEAGNTVRLSVETLPDGARLRLRAQGEQASWLAVDLLARDGEHFAGLGERFDGVDQRGRSVDLRVVNGATRDLTYKPVPFYMTNLGYAVRIEGDMRSVVRLATADDPATVSIRHQGNQLTLRLFHGRDLKELLGLYTAEIGRPAVPPPWVFSPWKSRDWTVEDQHTVLEDVRLGRKHSLAGSVKLIDATWEPDTHTFTFDERKYPDPEAMIREVTALGYKLVIWISPFMVHGLEPSPAFREAAERGYLIKREDGSTYVHRLGNSPTYIGSCIDFTNPAAVDWWQENIRRLVQLGVAGFKTDFGEQVPDDAVFFDGRRGSEVRNVFPRLYNQATYDAMQAETDGVLLARSAWEGSQAISAIWAGDQSSDFGPATGLPSVIVAGQTAGLSGFPYWASDIGGYFGVPSDEVFARWAQFGAFSPIMQVHGMGRREPWEFSEETLANYRRHAQLHQDLFPYLFSHAHHSQRTGLPLMRALALEFPDDPRSWDEMGQMQYLLGSELLVAPVYYGYNYYRHTWFPHGAWLDFHTGARFEGGREHVVPAGLDTIPVFARAGSIVPMTFPSAQSMLPTRDDITPAAGDDLLLRVYPGACGRFELFDRSEFIWDDRERRLRVRNRGSERRYTVVMMGGPAARPELRDSSGREVPLTQPIAEAPAGASSFSMPAGAEYAIIWRNA